MGSTVNASKLSAHLNNDMILFDLGVCRAPQFDGGQFYRDVKLRKTGIGRSFFSTDMRTRRTGLQTPHEKKSYRYL
jgi:hypothetical protein